MRWRFVILGLVLAAIAGALVLSRRAPRRAPRFVVQATAEGLPPRALEFLVSDLVENLGGWIPVDPPTGLPVPKGARRITLRASRQGDRLRLQALVDGRPLAPFEGPPSEAFDPLLRDLGLPPSGPSLVPREATRFWELMDLLGGPTDAPREDLDRRAKVLVEQVPDCATPRVAWALYTTRLLVELTPPPAEAQQRCEQNMREGLQACPAHPRLTGLLATFLTDTGRQREALDLLLEALKVHPQAPSLLAGVAYAGRTTGLLELADKALDRQAALTGLPRFHSGLADNTKLYLGDVDAFETGLPRVTVESIRVFYKGYARLLRKDPQGALAAFREAQQPIRGTAIFLRLSSVYRLALEGDQEGALRELRAMEDQRVQVRVPDSEVTFKLAEAYGYLGQSHRALDVMGKASVQGFGCTRWYERSPFLAGARKLPAWPRLHQALLERQALMEQRYPPDLIPGP
ncbi:MAG TPA: hypothetical protein VJ600_11250 [Holophagaceae bacterium]|nr:hypothetical protein [Holophagaceae bacterium]